MNTRSLALLLAVLLLLTACGSPPTLSPQTTASPTNAHGDRVEHLHGRTVIFPEELPAIIDYNDNYVTVKSMDAYELEANFEHTLYIVATIDYSALSESEFHWFVEEDLTISAYATHEKNGYDFKKLSLLGKLYDSGTDTLWIVFTSSFFDTNRYDFGGAEVILSVDVKQEAGASDVETNSGESIGLHYSKTLQDNLPSANTIKAPLIDWIEKWLGEYGDFIGSLAP